MAGKYTDEERIARGQYRDENGDWRTSSGYRIRTSGGTARDEDAQEAAPAAGAGSAVQTLKKQKKELEESAREAARQVYLDRMLTEKVLPQQLTASGRTGGLEDRTRNRLEESYEKQQKEIIKQRDEAKDEIDEQIRAIRRAQSEAAEYENFETGGGREETEPESRVLGSYSVSPQSPAAAQAVSQPAAKKLTYQEAAAQMRKEGVGDAAIAGLMTQNEWKRRKNAGSASAGDYADYDDYARAHAERAVGLKRQDGKEEDNREEKIQNELNRILDRQYSLGSPFEIPQILDIDDPVTVTFLSTVFNNPLAPIADHRMKKSLREIFDNKKAILEAEKEFGIPREVIGSVILKEMYTQSIPDNLANNMTDIGVRYSLFEEMLPGIFGSHTTGLGAIHPNTARAAWENYIGKEETEKFLPRSNQELQKKLTDDIPFNIRTIAATLYMEAEKAGFIESPENLYNFTLEQWRKVLKGYNGADRYGKLTVEYFPYMKEFLE